MRQRFKLINYIVMLVIVILAAGLAVLIFGRMDETVEAYGVVRPARCVTVKPRVNGIIENILVRENDLVREGDTLVILLADDLGFQVERSKQMYERVKADLAQLQEEYQNLILSESFETQSAFANLYQAKIRAEIAREKYERAEELYEKSMISSEEKDDKKLDYELSQSYYGAIRERAELLEKRYLLQIREKEKEAELAKKEYELATEKLGKSVVTAPIQGNILTPGVEDLIGEKAMEGKGILEIGDLAELDFIGELDEAYIPDVKPGQEARIFINAFPHRRYKVFQGEVAGISPKPRPTSSGVVFEVKMRINDPLIEISSSSIALKPGLSGKAKIVIGYKVRLIEMVFGLKRRFGLP